MINCIIVDDEQHAIDILTHYIAQTTTLHLVKSTTNPVDGLELVNQGGIDLVFLDIQMPGITGIDFVRAINGKAKVILTTAYSEFALEGYELDVVDYLLKPIRLARFLTAVQKAVASIDNSGPAVIPEDDDHIFVKTEFKGKLLRINLDDIDYIEGMKNYVAIFCNGKKNLVYTTMKEMEEQLSKRKFLRVHKSFIIPVNRITGIEGNMVHLKNVATEILIGESYKDPLMDIIRSRMIR